MAQQQFSVNDHIYHKHFDTSAVVLAVLDNGYRVRGRDGAVFLLQSGWTANWRVGVR